MINTGNDRSQADEHDVHLDSMFLAKSKTVTSNLPPLSRHCWNDELVARTSTLGWVFVCKSRTIRQDQEQVSEVFSRGVRDRRGDNTFLQFTPNANHH